MAKKKQYILVQEALNRNMTIPILQPDPLKDGLVLDLPLDEGGGLIAFDRSGNNNGTIAGSAPTWTNASLESALYLPGTDETIHCGFPIALGPMTISFWAKFPTGYTTRKGIIQTDGGYEGLTLEPVSGRFRLRLGTSNSAVYYGGLADITSTMRHYCLTITGSGQTDVLDSMFYIDTNPLYIGDSTTTGAADSWNEFEFGKNQYGNVQCYVSKISIHNRVLTLSEIQDLYIRDRNAHEPERIEFWLAEAAVTDPATPAPAPPISLGTDYTEIVNDGVGVADTKTQLQALIRALAESLGIADAPANVSIITRAVAESLGIADSATKNEAKTLSEILGIADADAHVLSIIRTLSESLGIADSEAKVLAAIRIISESLGITDVITQGGFIIIAETLGITDAYAKAQSLSLADLLGIIDDATALNIVVRLFDNSVGITDASTSSAAFVRLLANSLGIAESVVPLYVATRLLADSIGIADDTTKLWASIRIIAESLGLTDEKTAISNNDVVELINNALGLSDATSTLRASVRAIAETMGLSDEINRVIDALLQLTSVIGIGDTLTQLFGLSFIISDDLGLADEESELRGAVFAFADSIGITEDLSRVITFLRTNSETVGLEDSMAKIMVKLLAIGDSVGIADEVIKSTADIVKVAWAFLKLKKR